MSKFFRIKNSVSTKIFLQTTSVIVIICVVLGQITYSKSSKALYNQIENSLQSKTKDEALLISSKINENINALQAVTARPEIQSMDMNLQKDTLISEGKRMNFSGLFYS